MNNVELCPYCRQPMPKPAMTQSFSRGYGAGPRCEYRSCVDKASFLTGGRFLCYKHKVEVYGD